MKPVVMYDQEAMRAWLLSREGVEDRYSDTVAEELSITADSSPLDGELLGALDDLLSRRPAGWTVREDVTSIGVWPTSDGALITVDVQGFPRVASQHQDGKWFSMQSGTDAALESLDHIADVANQLGEQIARARA